MLEVFSLGGQPVVFHGIHYPAALLPWYWLQHLPAVSSALPDRLAILADGAAAAALAFSLDLARSQAPRGRAVALQRRSCHRGGGHRAAAADPAALPGSSVTPVPAGWQAAFASLRLTRDARVLVVPVPWGQIPQPLRWQADTGEPGSIIGGAFIAPNEQGRKSRAGRAGQTVTTRYLNALWEGTAPAVVADASPDPGRSRDLAACRGRRGHQPGLAARPVPDRAFRPAYRAIGQRSRLAPLTG